MAWVIASPRRQSQEPKYLEHSRSSWLLELGDTTPILNHDDQPCSFLLLWTISIYTTTPQKKTPYTGGQWSSRRVTFFMMTSPDCCSRVMIVKFIMIFILENLQLIFAHAHASLQMIMLLPKQQGPIHPPSTATCHITQVISSASAVRIIFPPWWLSNTRTMATGRLISGSPFTTPFRME